MIDKIEFKTSDKKEDISLYIGSENKLKFKLYSNSLNKDRYGLADSLNKMIENWEQSDPEKMRMFLYEYIQILKNIETGSYPVYEFINDCVRNTKEHSLLRYVENMFFPYNCLKDSNYMLTKAGMMVKLHIPLFSHYVSKKISGDNEDMVDVLYSIITTFVENFYPDALSIIDITCNDINDVLSELIHIDCAVKKKILTYTITRTLYRMEKHKDNLHALRMYVYSLYKIEYNSSNRCAKLHDVILPIIERKEEEKNGVR